MVAIYHRHSEHVIEYQYGELVFIREIKRYGQICEFSNGMYIVRHLNNCGEIIIFPFRAEQLRRISQVESEP